jgi:hypothetical protein
MPAELPNPGQRAPAAWRCSCGFWADDLELFEDHLFTFPEDDHYELARDQEIAPKTQRVANSADDSVVF